MAWGVTAETGRFGEAVDWFRSRVPYTFEQLGALEDKARANAFWIAGGVELAAIRGIFDELGRAIEKGTSLQDFKRDIRAKLPGAIRDQHLTVVFRNAVQTALNTGRWQQMTEPDVKRFRPYWMYDAILDGRTTPICNTLNGTVKSADDAFWLSRWPPLHHQCRSSVRSLRRSEALRRGITQGVPDGDPQGGFGAAPPVQSDPPKPDVKKLDPQVHDAYRARKQQMERELAEAERKAREQRERQTPEYWFEREYREKYGEDAGRSVAWGRAMEERGRAVSMQEARRQFEQISATGLVIDGAYGHLFDDWIKQLQSQGKIRKDPAGLGDVIDDLERASADGHRFSRDVLHDVKALSALIGHRNGIRTAGREPVDFGVSRHDKDATDAVKRATAEAAPLVEKFFSELADRSVTIPDRKLGYRLHWENARARFDKAARTIYVRYSRIGEYVNTSLHTVVHEVAHGIEFHNERALRSASQFLVRRTEGESLQRMRDITGEDGYADHEVTKKDRFFSPYMGKEYLLSDGSRYATEVSSMLLEQIYSEASKLVAEDPEGFWFALGQLAGDAQ